MLFLGSASTDGIRSIDNKKIGYEFKYTKNSKLTKSMQTAHELLILDSLKIIYPGNISFPLADNIEAVGFEKCLAPQEIN